MTPRVVPPFDERLCPVEVTIGVQNVARELSIETESDTASVTAAVQAALEPGGVLRLTDSRGREVFVRSSTRELTCAQSSQRAADPLESSEARHSPGGVSTD